VKGLTMSEKELEQIGIFEQLRIRKIKQKDAAATLSITTRQLRRKIKLYELHGAKSLAHQSRGRASNNQTSQGQLDLAINLIRSKYHDFAPTLAHEKLLESYNFKFSAERLRQEMVKEGLWQAKSRKKTRVFQLRERRACFGELLQIDGSPHDWFEGRAPRCNLNATIDDATGDVSFDFSKTETTKDYFVLLKAYFTTHGLPVAIYSDKHSIFRVNTPSNLDFKKPSRDKENGEYDGLTQFGRAMKELGIELIFANTPQAKGRIERLNQTLQDRLVKEMRLKNISSISEANQFCKSFAEKFNRKFTRKPSSEVNMHRPLDPKIDLDSILCIKEYRYLSKNLSFQYQNYIYQIKISREICERRLRGSEITIFDHCDDRITLRDKHNNLFDYTVIKKLPKTKATSSKELNQALDQLKNRVIKNAQYPWEKQAELFGI